MKCPNCQREIPADSKFCTYCGFQIPQVSTAGPTGAQPQNSQPQFGPNNQGQQNQFNANQGNFNQNMNQNMNQQTSGSNININIDMDQTSVYAKNYWSYLIHGVKRPADFAQPFNKYFGLISLLISSLFIALTLTMVEIHAAGGVLGNVDSLLNTNTQSVAGFGTFFGVLLLSIIGEFVLFSMAHLVVRGFLGDKSVGYMADLTRFQHIMSLGVFVLAAGFIFSILGTIAIALATLCVFFYDALLSCAYVALIFMAKPTNHFDRVYAFLVSGIILFVVALVVFTIVGVGIGWSIIGNLFNSFE
ncbi:zinc ribbon domain-containing protein [Secundilactobacillus folii]|nr:zinc ribbon domain-containing protein [Secundilactobacillus folii]